MRSSDGDAPADRSAGVDALLDAVAVLAEADVAGTPVPGRLAEVRQLWPALCAAQAQLLRRVADLHRVGAAAEDGFVSTTSWLRRRLHLDGGRAALLVRTGTGLDERAPTSAALADGAISVEHAAAIVAAAADLGEQVMTDEVEKILVDFARDHTPAEVRHLARQIKLALVDDESAAQRQARQYEGRWFNAARTFEGMVHIEGMFDPVAGAQILAALAAFTPGPDRDGERTARQRRADAFTDLCTAALASKTRGGDGADTPQVTLTVSWETLSATFTDYAQPDPHDNGDSGDSGGADAADQAVPSDAGEGAESAEARTATSGDAHHDPTSPAEPALWPRWLGPPPAKTSGPDQADRIGEVLAGLGDPLRPGGPAVLGHLGEPIGAETARRLACDAGIIPVVLGSRSEALDIGRLSRVVPTALRRAVDLRDKTCRFPGCDRPPSWCDCHHLIHWAHGGATCLANLILLCRFHHTRVHEYGWTLRLDSCTGDVRAVRPDGKPYDLISRHDRLESPRAGPSP